MVINATIVLFRSMQIKSCPKISTNNTAHIRVRHYKIQLSCMVDPLILSNMETTNSELYNHFLQHVFHCKLCTTEL